MRIGISSTSFIKNKKIDGIGVYTESLVNNLKKNNSIKIEEIFFDGFHFQNNNFSDQPNPFFSAFFPFGMHKNLESKIDLFHSTDYFVPKLKNTPVISTIHDAIMIKEPYFANKKLRFIKNFLLKKHVKYSNHVIAISYSMVSDLVNYWKIPPEKISVIYNAIDSFWSEKSTVIEKEKTLNKFKINKPFFLFVGTIQPRKNIERMLLAYDLLPKEIKSNFIFIIVGKTSILSKDLENKILSYQEKGSVKWLSYVDKIDLKNLYQSSVSLLFPSLSEGFGMPILEGFASEVPVITSNINPMSEIAKNSAYLVNPYDIENISLAMNDLCTNNELREKLIQKGKQRLSFFTWETYLKEILLLYKSLLR
ncbi:MAG: glycosyltransferase family 4 protein [Parachlamydiales bacterium]|nr:glycosyltransferase family 4 protein [Parachlamydiales bacterium]